MGRTSFKNLVSKIVSDIWNIKTIIVLVIFVLGLMVYLNINGITSDYKYRINLIDRTAYLINYTGHDKEITVPHKIGPFTVSDADRNTYTNCDFIEKVFVPAKVEYLTYFDHVDGLKELEFEQGTIKAQLYVSGSKNLSTIIFPEGVESIVGLADGCKSLKNVSIPRTTKYMDVVFINTSYIDAHKKDLYYVAGDGGLVFYNGSYENDVIIPEGVKQISDTKLNYIQSENKCNIYLPDSLEYNLAFVGENVSHYYGKSSCSKNNNDYFEDISGNGEIVGNKDSKLKDLCKNTHVTFREITPEEDALRREKTEAAAAEITYQE